MSRLPAFLFHSSTTFRLHNTLRAVTSVDDDSRFLKLTVAMGFRQVVHGFGVIFSLVGRSDGPNPVRPTPPFGASTPFHCSILHVHRAHAVLRHQGKSSILLRQPRSSTLSPKPSAAHPGCLVRDDVRLGPADHVLT